MQNFMKKKVLFVGCVLAALCGSLRANEATQLYWGDTHLHTSYSFDAFLSQNYSATPDTAYRWAKGQPVIHPYTHAKVRIGTPLDFLVVSDHAEALGVMRAVVNQTDQLDEELPIHQAFMRWFAKQHIRSKVSDNEGMDIFNELLPVKALNPEVTKDPVRNPANQIPNPVLGDLSKTRTSAWHDVVDAAERHYRPGKFTSFIGWEWSSTPTGANLHRVVVSPNGSMQAKQYLPFGSDQSQYPEDLWSWLDETSERTGSEFIAIPHNSNVSKGYMFAETTLRGEPMDVQYARTRMRWEPLVEMTQIKGDSETHSQLSPQDPFSDFENYPFYLQADPEAYRVAKGDYIRSGLRTGLEVEGKIGVNPYKFGLIGSTDSHTGISSAEEDNFWGKFAHDSTPENKRTDSMIGGTKATGWNMSAAGLAAVWAEENTRESLFSAFKRREVYATTGPRIRVRVFAGWGFPAHAIDAENIAELGYTHGVPMGGDLTQAQATDQPIQLLIRAVKDPKGANLDRVQVVKSWLNEKGQSFERIFNVAWSGDRSMDAQALLPSVGDTVDRETGQYTNTVGAIELSTLWQDPSFDAGQRAFYYVRVLQIPTPRHSLYDAVASKEINRGKIEIPSEGPAIIQERAYTSPIWYSP
ncbi:DUF3604 domain-containing protein [Microbulbifer sp. OS29]|uniref:DUF3604 domain-containing protein n=1 Tax=Microbulbifer okhotskensis TaxID=2926617 RepID=A0A9X2ERG0_9GAMM|nr:DUF3604 domain-containing protein [Microbulbifer okhotskensis]MCO1336430.1 DUF3604 domain-containing protein [Microbulbifer okhotskensis]